MKVTTFDAIGLATIAPYEKMENASYVVKIKAFSPFAKPGATLAELIVC
jgi:hypothetical protein